ncbi:MAG TPA: tetratricopeptide repeat protein [Terracidiphilus sp.]
MKFIESKYLSVLVLSIALCCILLSAPNKILALTNPVATDSDVPSTRIALEPHSVADQIKLAQGYFDGRGVQQDTKKAAYWYEKAAGAGDPFAQFEIGYLYESGIGVDKNPERATHWYQLAAASGLPMAEVNLAVAYLWGTGVPKDEASAFRLMSAAAAQGNGLAACYLGDFYAFGIATPQDRSKAEKWYRKGANLHDPIAEFDLARMLMNAEGKQDLATAAKLLRDSAAARYVPAMHELGLLLARNPALAVSAREAFELLNTAAEAGNWKSSVLLGVLERDGNGVPVDIEAAYYHFRVGALKGGDEARRLTARDLELLSAQLGQGRTAAIDLKASDWYKQRGVNLMFVRNDEKNPREFAVISGGGEHVAVMMMSSPTL